MMDFGEAIRKMKGGWHVARENWNGRNMDICIQVPDDDSKMDLPYIYMKTAHGELVPWVANQADMLAEDWQIVWLMGPESEDGNRIRQFFIETYTGRVFPDVAAVGQVAPISKLVDEAQAGYREARDVGAFDGPGTAVGNAVSERPGRFEEALNRQRQVGNPDYA